MQGRQLPAENISNETVSFLVNLFDTVGFTKRNGGRNQAKKQHPKDIETLFIFHNPRENKLIKICDYR
jgi:hypothetical protein